jgi:membrane fusion protein (multidrug efflux system)
VVLFRNGKAEFREIETGIRNSGRVQVISGIQEGDTVLTSGLMFVKPAAELKLTAIEGGQ